TLDAPQPFNTGNNSLVFYKTADYLPVFPGQTPNASEITYHVDVVATRNEFETTFFNVYFGANVQGIAEVALSNLVRTNATGSEQIGCKDVMVRTVKYWWQAGSGTLSVDKEAIPAFIPELLLYNEASVPTAPSNATVQIPSESNLCDSTGSSTTFANIQANTSKQFSITLRPDGNRTPGTYQGTISVKLINGSVYSIPIYINILDITLRAFNKYATIYNEFSGTLSPNSELKTKYRNQLKDIRDHGFNGVIILAGKEKEYLDLAVETGLSSFTMFKSLENIATTKAWFTERNMRTLFLGQDEPHLRSDVPQALAWQVLDANKIHSAGGEVASTINKEYADQLNNPLKFPWASTGIPFTLGKLDFPILNAEPPTSDTTSSAYFSSLIAGTKSPDRQELIYWQAAREHPRVNRYFAGYFIYLSRLAGIAPYIYQKNRDNIFNDFVVRSNGERSLNLVYPSIEGGIDTIQWESMREGIDDHRMLQLFDQFYQRLLVKNQTAASSFKAELDTLMQKYKSWAGSKSLATEDFSKDRISLLNLLTRMQNSIVAHTVQLSISENEDDGWEFEDGGQIYRPNGYQIFTDAGGNYFGTWASYSHYGAALRFHIPLTAKKSSSLYSATLRLLRNNVSTTGTPKVAIKAYKNTNCTAFSNTNRPYRDGVEYTTASTLLEFPNPELNAVGSWIDIDITTIMRELMQQPTWVGTNSSICLIGINLMTTGSHEFGIRDSAEGAYSSPRLILDYE
ncbi:MAG TPA: hypothetical protein PKD17_03695, partial [Cellvibrionaceae bacterium]|nr:hypothetical protein [Cellvibrionaceae bacterium]